MGPEAPPQWGIIHLAVIELGMRIPPIGVTLFVLHGRSPDIPLSPDIPIRTIYRGVMPFIIADLILLALLALFAEISRWLPALLKS